MSDLIERQAAIDANCIDWCNRKYSECPYFDNVGTDEKHCDGCDTVFILKNLPSEPQWILCSKQLPEDGKWCLFTDGLNISVERYKADAIDHFFPQGRWFNLEDAVAWMPLPTKPYVEQT